MGSSASSTFFYGEGDLQPWLIISLWSMNTITTVVTGINLAYLMRALPNVVERSWNQAIEQSMTKSITKSTRQRQYSHSVQSDQNSSMPYYDVPDGYTDPAVLLERRRAWYRRHIQLYFYFICIIPLGVSAVAHYGARFPHEAIWIMPGMNIVIAVAFLAFMRMMIMSCEGWTEVRLLLRDQEDECKSCKNRPLFNMCCISCCLKSNALLGLYQKMIWCFLIVIKPLITYLSSYFEYDYGTDYDAKNIIFYVMKILTLFTTFVPMQTMKSFYLTLAPYTRLRRCWIKMIFVALLAPVCQIQEMSFEFSFKAIIKRPLGFEGLDEQYRWACAYGILLCLEMMIMSMVITSVAFRPKDLRLWTFSECMLKPNERTPYFENVGAENQEEETTGTMGDATASLANASLVSYDHVNGIRKNS